MATLYQSGASWRAAAPLHPTSALEESEEKEYGLTPAQAETPQIVAKVIGPTGANALGGSYAAIQQNIETHGGGTVAAPGGGFVTVAPLSTGTTILPGALGISPAPSKGIGSNAAAIAAALPAGSTVDASLMKIATGEGYAPQLTQNINVLGGYGQGNYGPTQTRLYGNINPLGGYGAGNYGPTNYPVITAIAPNLNLQATGANPVPLAQVNSIFQSIPVLAQINSFGASLKSNPLGNFVADLESLPVVGDILTGIQQAGYTTKLQMVAEQNPTQSNIQAYQQAAGQIIPSGKATLPATPLDTLIQNAAPWYQKNVEAPFANFLSPTSNLPFLGQLDTAANVFISAPDLLLNFATQTVQGGATLIKNAPEFIPLAVAGVGMMVGGAYKGITTDPVKFLAQQLVYTAAFSEAQDTLSVGLGFARTIGKPGTELAGPEGIGTVPEEGYPKLVGPNTYERITGFFRQASIPEESIMSRTQEPSAYGIPVNARVPVEWLSNEPGDIYSKVLGNINTPVSKTAPVTASSILGSSIDNLINIVSGDNSGVVNQPDFIPKTPLVRPQIEDFLTPEEIQARTPEFNIWSAQTGTPGWWNRVTSAGGLYNIPSGGSEIKAMYGAPILETMFASLSGSVSDLFSARINLSPFGLRMPSFNVFTNVEEMIKVPSELSSARDWEAITEWTQNYMVEHPGAKVSFLPLNKGEYETVIPAGAQVKAIKIGYTTAAGLRVPIFQNVLTGEFTPIAGETLGDAIAKGFTPYEESPNADISASALTYGSQIAGLSNQYKILPGLSSGLISLGETELPQAIYLSRTPNTNVPDLSRNTFGTSGGTKSEQGNILSNPGAYEDSLISIRTPEIISSSLDTVSSFISAISPGAPSVSKITSPSSSSRSLSWISSPLTGGSSEPYWHSPLDPLYSDTSSPMSGLSSIRESRSQSSDLSSMMSSMSSLLSSEAYGYSGEYSGGEYSYSPGEISQNYMNSLLYGSSDQGSDYYKKKRHSKPYSIFRELLPSLSPKEELGGFKPMKSFYRAIGKGHISKVTPTAEPDWIQQVDLDRPLTDYYAAEKARKSREPQQPVFGGQTFFRTPTKAEKAKTGQNILRYSPKSNDRINDMLFGTGRKRKKGGWF